MNLTTNTTQRIDRLSNNKLYLGLKTGVSLQAETSLLTIGSANGEVLLKLGTVYKAPTEATHVAPKGYVELSFNSKDVMQAILVETASDEVSQTAILMPMRKEPTEE